MRRTRIFALGGPQLTPFAAATRAEFDIRDLPRALLTRSDVHLVAGAAELTLLSRMYQEHYGVRVRRCDHFRGERVVVYDIRAAAGPLAAGCAELP